MTDRRRGFTLTETLVAGVILATAATVAMQMLVAAAGQRRSLDARQAALIEAGNVMERLAAKSWEELDAAELSKLTLGERAVQALPSGKLEIQIEPIAAQPDDKLPAAKRLTVAVSYGGEGEGTQKAREVRLVAWRYERPAGKTEVKEEVK